MTVYRRHPITGELIVVAPQRSARPNAFGSGNDEEPCPFCAGNEHLTPPEIARKGTPGAWSVRVFPNKYPAVDAGTQDETGRLRGGAHEVIVESPDHAATIESLPATRMGDTVDIYIERFGALAASYPSVSIFKNDGAAAGASLRHVHSQVIALPFMPARTAEEVAGFREAATCPLCDLVAQPRFVIRESESFLTVAPAAARMAYEQWIVPRVHAPSFAALDAGARGELAEHLQSDVASLRRRIPGTAFNWAFHNFAEGAAHWYVALFPRVTLLAGFELGSGTAIDVVGPEATVEALRLG
jgi:UDPglucose--hexose-1-phosphate uridylyltransferase